MTALKGDDGASSGYTPGATHPYGVWGDSGICAPFGGGGNGVVGSSKCYSGVVGVTLADSPSAAGVFATGPYVGVAGWVKGASGAYPRKPVAVYGAGSNGSSLGAIGVQGIADSATGVEGDSQTGTGVVGSSTNGDGVQGLTRTGAGVLGVSGQNIGLAGISNGVGVLGWGGTDAGVFYGDTYVSGKLTKSGGGFRIDHPYDPENQCLSHSFVESPEMKNFYDGVTTLGPDGGAVVELPSWFDGLNEDCRYQLTALGRAAPNLHVSSELTENRFAIAGGEPAMRVSWQVTGVRRDAWAVAHPVEVEEKKPASERGSYLNAEEHGQPAERSLFYVRHAEFAAHRDSPRDS